MRNSTADAQRTTRQIRLLGIEPEKNENVPAEGRGPKVHGGVSRNLQPGNSPFAGE